MNSIFYENKMRKKKLNKTNVIKKLKALGPNLMLHFFGTANGTGTRNDSNTPQPMQKPMQQ